MPTQRTRQKPPPGWIFIEDYVAPDGTVIDGIATRLGIEPGTYRKWRMAGKGPAAIVHGRKVIARIEDVDAYLEEQLQASLAPQQEARPPEPRLTRRPREKTAARQPATAAA